uniref:Uncharacterized protein n=1 Tax=Knipowitschia caucasica TaxID=637954 RepID=A0AAV2JA66_KNICA
MKCLWDVPTQRPMCVPLFTQQASALTPTRHSEDQAGAEGGGRAEGGAGGGAEGGAGGGAEGGAGVQLQPPLSVSHSHRPEGPVYDRCEAQSMTAVRPSL